MHVFYLSYITCSETELYSSVFGTSSFLTSYFSLHLKVYLHVQISRISCNVVGSILHVLGKNTDTAIVGYRWTGVRGHHALYC